MNAEQRKQLHEAAVPILAGLLASGCYNSTSGKERHVHIDKTVISEAVHLAKKLREEVEQEFPNE